jgi:hypothetical protein
MGNELVMHHQCAKTLCSLLFALGEKVYQFCSLYPRRSSLMACAFGVLGLVISTNFGQQEKSITALIEVY